MSLLPCVTVKDRESVARDFDLPGPDACTAEIIEHLEEHNPALLDIGSGLPCSTACSSRRLPDKLP